VATELHDNIKPVL